MPLGGGIPGPDSTRARYPWTDVPNVAYRGPHPDLPPGLPPQTKAWWKALCAMPHCVLWTDAEWCVAVATSLIHAAFVKHNKYAVELRRRENSMGMTRDALLRMRIRYVDPEPKQTKTTPVAVTNLEAERRKRLERKGL